MLWPTNVVDNTVPAPLARISTATNCHPVVQSQVSLPRVKGTVGDYIDETDHNKNQRTHFETIIAVRSASSLSSGPSTSSAVLEAPSAPMIASSSSSNGETRAYRNPPVPSSASNSEQETHLPTPRHMTRYCPLFIMRASLISRIAPVDPVAGYRSGKMTKRRVPDRHLFTKVI